MEFLTLDPVWLRHWFGSIMRKVNLEGHSVRKYFCSIFSQKKFDRSEVYFTKFDLFTIFRFSDITGSISP